MVIYSRVTKRVTHGGPLSLTIFNIVVGVAIFHWVALVVVEEARPDSFGRAIQWLAALFNANDGLVTFPRPNQI